jgi:hypothetical protein
LPGSERCGGHRNRLREPLAKLQLQPQQCCGKALRWKT